MVYFINTFYDLREKRRIEEEETDSVELFFEEANLMNLINGKRLKMNNGTQYVCD